MSGPGGRRRRRSPAPSRGDPAGYVFGPAGYVLGSAGFALVEAIVALAVLAIALLLGLALALQEPRAVRRIEAQRQALRAVEATLESIRAGAVPLRSTRLDGFLLAAGRPLPEGLTLDVDVAPELPAGLYRVTLRAQTAVYGQPVERRVETLVWRPPP